MKNQYSSDGTTIQSSDLSSSVDAPEKKEIGADNVGHKLLKLMGWTGGGLGKGGGGISEPVSAAAISNREGLGSASAGKAFKQKVRTLIEEYAKSSNPHDLVFTTGFTNEQRKEMHQYVQFYMSIN